MCQHLTVIFCISGSIHYDFPEVKRPSTFIFGAACLRFLPYSSSRAHRMHQLYPDSPQSVWITCKPLLFSATRTVYKEQRITTFDSLVVSVQATEVNVPARHLALPQGYLGPFSNDAGAVVTSASSVGSLATADTTAFPSEISRVCPIPIRFTNTAAGTPQVTPQPYRRPCEWKDNKGRICGELVGWYCQDHLAIVHGIVNISGSTHVTCGACSEKKIRLTYTAKRNPIQLVVLDYFPRGVVIAAHPFTRAASVPSYDCGGE
ncbi:hypothetical protein F5J12DRAFT_783808 [Pisolithus orientalis]|uniref:uncharacterized protein n=1 Tax=Pisolithus orientalis TaxID=936130 RepID=UPI002224485C|nr:uncharacterized protein F5J12DRAFT_783808 [Pisolithus orientalis]KAI6002647.1 hypothetical protein F5J12DRAFT_783808 [Pisolithus orientalis]